MEELPEEWGACLNRRLDQKKVRHADRPRYHQWVKFYLHFCQKFGYPAATPTALGPFLTKLAEENHSID